MSGLKFWEPVRQIVLAPDGRFWALSAEGTVKRQITLEAIGGWTAHTTPPVESDGVISWMPPAGHAGPPWEIHRKSWAQMAKLARCTCEGTKPEGEHYLGCCLVHLAAGKMSQ